MRDIVKQAVISSAEFPLKATPDVLASARAVYVANAWLCSVTVALDVSRWRSLALLPVFGISVSPVPMDGGQMLRHKANYREVVSTFEA